MPARLINNKLVDSLNFVGLAWPGWFENSVSFHSVEVRFRTDFYLCEELDVSKTSIQIIEFGLVNQLRLILNLMKLHWMIVKTIIWKYPCIIQGISKFLVLMFMVCIIHQFKQFSSRKDEFWIYLFIQKDIISYSKWFFPP